MSSCDDHAKDPDPRPYRVFYDNTAPAPETAPDSTTPQSIEHGEKSGQFDADVGTVALMATGCAAITGVTILTAATLAAHGHP